MVYPHGFDLEIIFRSVAKIRGLTITVVPTALCGEGFDPGPMCRAESVVYSSVWMTVSIAIILTSERRVKQEWIWKERMMVRSERVYMVAWRWPVPWRGNASRFCTVVSEGEILISIANDPEYVSSHWRK